MERAAGYATITGEGDRFILLEATTGYRHFFFAPAIRNVFFFSYCGCFFRCIALPFGWSRSAKWFTKILVSFANRIKGRGFSCSQLYSRLLDGPASSRAVTREDYLLASERIQTLLDDLGIATKGV